MPELTSRIKKGWIFLLNQQAINLLETLQWILSVELDITDGTITTAFDVLDNTRLAN